jgi:hypothetical protein
MGLYVKHQACFDTVHRTTCRGASSGFRLAHTMPLLRKIGTCFSVLIGTPVGVLGRDWERFGTEKRDTSEQKATDGDSDDSRVAPGITPWRPGSRGALLLPSPLRTTRKPFGLCRSSLSQGPSRNPVGRTQALHLHDTGLGLTSGARRRPHQQ